MTPDQKQQRHENLFSAFRQIRDILATHGINKLIVLGEGFSKNYRQKPTEPTND